MEVALDALRGKRGRGTLLWGGEQDISDSDLVIPPFIQLNTHVLDRGWCFLSFLSSNSLVRLGRTSPSSSKLTSWLSL
jgi:hypothetical protein